MDKKMVFHQFIRVEEGYKNCLIINFLRKEYFIADKEHVKGFISGEIDKESEFVKLLKENGLVIEVDNSVWIPPILFEEHEMELDTIEIEKGADISRIRELLSFYNIKTIKLYDFKKEVKIVDNVKYELYKKDFNECYEFVRNDKKIFNVNKDIYFNNMKYNFCYFNKMSITKDNKIRPCIYSNIEVADISEEPDVIIDKMKTYWQITKDMIEKCKDCEFRYLCLDCRETAYRESGDLYSPPSSCKYDPYKGDWK